MIIYNCTLSCEWSSLFVEEIHIFKVIKSTNVHFLLTVVCGCSNCTTRAVVDIGFTLGYRTCWNKHCKQDHSSVRIWIGFIKKMLVLVILFNLIFQICASCNCYDLKKYIRINKNVMVNFLKQKRINWLHDIGYNFMLRVLSTWISYLNAPLPLRWKVRR